MHKVSSDDLQQLLTFYFYTHSFGQSDSLTHRLHTLLQDYTDGFAVPKELVQNADDAGQSLKGLLQLIVRAFAANFWYRNDSSVMVVWRPHYKF